MPRTPLSAHPRRNFHVPLPEDLYRALHQEAARAQRPANALARDAIAHWIALQRQARLDEAIAAYATALAGSSADLDPDLEAASLELWEHEP